MIGCLGKTLTSEENVLTAIAAALALADRRAESGREVLMMQLDSAESHPLLRVACIEALARLSQDVHTCEWLMTQVSSTCNTRRLTESPTVGDRFLTFGGYFLSGSASAEALGECGGEQARELLVATLNGDRYPLDLRISCAFGLTRNPRPRDIDTLAAQINNESVPPWLRWACGAALAKVGHISSSEFLKWT